MLLDIESYILEINTAIQSAKKANLKIFELLLDARNTLSTNEYDKLKTKIDLSKSTLQKFEKIFSNRVIMNNIEQLPFSWSVLLEMTRVEDDELQKLIDDKTFNAKTTKKEVANVLKSSKEVTDPSSVAEDTTSNDVTDPSSVVEETTSNDVTDPSPVAEETTSNDVTDPTSIESYDSTPSTLEPFMTVTIKEDVELDDVREQIAEAERAVERVLSVYSDILDIQFATLTEEREAA